MYATNLAFLSGFSTEKTMTLATVRRFLTDFSDISNPKAVFIVSLSK